jgi:hypothetical protein
MLMLLGLGLGSAVEMLICIIAMILLLDFIYTPFVSVEILLITSDVIYIQLVWTWAGDFFNIL